MVSRRRFIGSLIGTAGLMGAGKSPIGRCTPSASNGEIHQTTNLVLINRSALVTRHNPILRKLDPLSPLSLGNGEFAFTADITGLQTFPLEYKAAMPLCTMSQWGWHTAPLPTGLNPNSLRLSQFDTHGRQVGYQTSSEGQAALFNWLRENPHRLHLGQIGLRLHTPQGREATPADIATIEQSLVLWTGILTSRFTMQSVPVMVRTAVHPTLALLAVSIESALIKQGRLAVRFSFPYGSSSMQAADWTQPRLHQTKMIRQNGKRSDYRRMLDKDDYFVAVEYADQAEINQENEHSLVLQPARNQPRLEFVVSFSPDAPNKDLPLVAATFAATAEHWQHFWQNGSAVELVESKDPRALELERRMVLSQYLTAIQCSGSVPPPETGLTVNSWYGKFHLEMHWWHATHFALWQRLQLLERSLDWYDSIIASARARARAQGYEGARWPKMTALDGRDSPSPIGPLLIWQQPHPIFYAELCYKTRPQRQTLKRFQQIVFDTAEFMASYAFFHETQKRYVLGPPVIPAQENHPPRETWNPTFELEYWRYGLSIAQAWRERLGMQSDARWARVIDGLSPLPMHEGVYVAHENCPQTFTERNSDHPSMLAALGVLPGNSVDRETMRRTLHRVMKEWQWEDTWGWDYPMTAMTAARLDEPQIAVDALLMKTEKNRYLPNGHNWQRPNLPCYLPGNGGLLYAIALMAGGWSGAPARKAPGFPANGSWTVRAENFNRALVP